MIARAGLIGTLALLLASRAVQGLQQDTVTLPVGSPLVDGRMYKDHIATAQVSVLDQSGKVLHSVRFVNNTFVTTRKGREVCIVRSEPYPGAADQQFFSEVVLDRRTMALLHIESRDGTGKALVADVDGAHVVGTYRKSRAAETESLDFTLSSPAFYFPFLDAAVGATPLRVGEVFRVPTFGFAKADRVATWRTYRLTRREPITVLGGPTLDSWVIEDGSQSIWMTEEAPYLPLVLSTNPDGSVVRFESAILPDTPRASAPSR